MGHYGRLLVVCVRDFFVARMCTVWLRVWTYFDGVYD